MLALAGMRRGREEDTGLTSLARHRLRITTLRLVPSFTIPPVNYIYAENHLSPVRRKKTVGKNPSMAAGRAAFRRKAAAARRRDFLRAAARAARMTPQQRLQTALDLTDSLMELREAARRAERAADKASGRTSKKN
jgi:hypothetical protein